MFHVIFHVLFFQSKFFLKQIIYYVKIIIIIFKKKGGRQDFIVQSDSGENKIKFEPRVKTSKILASGLGFFVFSFFFRGYCGKGLVRVFTTQLLGFFV